VREHASGGERGRNRSKVDGSPIKNDISYLNPAVLHGDQSSTKQGTIIFVMDSFKSAGLAVLTL